MKWTGVAIGAGLAFASFSAFGADVDTGRVPAGCVLGLPNTSAFEAMLPDERYEFEEPAYVATYLNMWAAGDRSALPLRPTSVVVLKGEKDDPLRLIYSYHGCTLAVLNAELLDVQSALLRDVGPAA